MRSVVLSKVMVVLPLAFAACGGSDDKAQPPPAVAGEQLGVLRTLDELQAASRSGDAAKICTTLFTKALADSIKAAGGRSCRREVKERFASPDEQISVSRQVTVQGARATATIREQNGNASRLSMVKDAGRWKIQGVQPLATP
jgi:hypothetical protein